ncbi:MAG: SGNH/GDSL hydrolase family protein [Flexilinea sp.]|nr:SGNH/GDSL hydrolase family protein [Flexilinea sp.]
MAEKQSNKKKKRIIIGVIIAILCIQGPLTWAIQSGRLFTQGNKAAYSVANTEPKSDSKLSGKTIIFLGSSVTYGSASHGESFVDYLEKIDGITAVKEALSGTTLVDKSVWGKKSYIARMKSIDPNIPADAFVVQLSTNDATMKKPLGTISESFSKEDFDTQTVAGAIEYVIAYARETWDCPVIFFTGTQYKNEHYAQMVDLLLEIQKKWDIGVLDLWNDPEMNAVSAEDYKLYMVNSIHPSRIGYRDWWTPKFESYLSDYLK